MPTRNFTQPLIWLGAVVHPLFCYLMPVTAAQGTVPGCQLQAIKASGFSRDGDILIGGIFWVHFSTMQRDITFREIPEPATCQTFGLQNYQWIRAMMFAIEEINSDPAFLPNITLGFKIYDSCMLLQRSLTGTLWNLSGQEGLLPNYQHQKSLPTAAIIGDSGSTRSILLARILGLYRYPQISYHSTSPILSDRMQFPSFFRTIPSDDFQSDGLAQLLIHFGWTWVGILAADDDYGQQGSQLVQKELIKAGSCVAFAENILLSRSDKNAFHIAQVIKNSTAKAIVAFSSIAYMIPVLDELVRQNVTGNFLIASEAWSTYSLLSIDKYSEILAGTIGFAIHSGEMVGFQEYFTRIHPYTSPGDTFVKKFWEEAFACQWLGHQQFHASNNISKTCTGTENMGSLPLHSMIDFRTTYNIYSAVYATALSLRDLRMCVEGAGPFLHGSCANISDFRPWQLLHYIKNMRLRSEDTGTFFDKHGNPRALYDIVNWQADSEGTIRHVKVGSYDSNAAPGKTLTINDSAVLWASGSTEVPVSVCSPSCPIGFRKATSPGKPICCYQCVACLLGEIANQTDSIECYKCPWDQWPNDKRERCIPKFTDFLTYKGTFGSILAAISIFSSVIPLIILGLFIHYKDTPIIKASNANLSYLLLLSLNLCFLSSLAFIGYPTLEKCLVRQVAFGLTFALCISCILAKTTMVVIAFNATKPNSDLRRWARPKCAYLFISVCTLIQAVLCVAWLKFSPPFPANNTHTWPGMIIAECNEGSPIAFWCMLGYLGLLATISFIVAFLARNLPDSFNEAKYITFSMIAFLTVWLSFIPAYLSTRGKYMAGMESFAILSSSSSLVSCIFFPKCYTILFRSDMNTKEYLMGRGAGQSTKVKRM
ncbi:extracellular calcium-sensing receptor-like [Ambystoma mexicanum]|uniref:extracellular calcium-sensing receptor-like n=1 Tax=Ambystoma mexicanum TaxID=8296 RepID=UPI0037E87C02